jgi:hypothetical protein
MDHNIKRKDIIIKIAGNRDKWFNGVPEINNRINKNCRATNSIDFIRWGICYVWVKI